MRVYICSPYSGDISENVRVAEALCRQAIRKGYAPFAPHLFYPKFLDDEKTDERLLGITLACDWLSACNMVWKYSENGVSRGMKAELSRARQLDIPIIEVTLERRL